MKVYKRCHHRVYAIYTPGKRSTHTIISSTGKTAYLIYNSNHLIILKMSHSHQEVDLDRPLIEYEHDMRDLAEELSHLLSDRSRHLSSTQRTVLEEYRSSKSVYKIREDSRIPEDDKIIAYVNLFNKLIFQGTLGGRVALELESESHYYKRAITKVIDGFAIITIWSQDWIRDPKERLQRYLGIVLHEMTHAFLRIYGCPDCRSRPDWQGKSGHGHAWQDLILAIQESVEDPGFLGLDLALNRLGSLQIELCRGGTLPSDASRRWGFTREEIRLAQRGIPGDFEDYV
ncbi:hypothetical protein EG329_003368 [Mollisiaceae sp. DMI_Dod_QoI]|nr:hypothetical protein EG329_003368 [Helotiales sp. DMI_Dod_QoI]